MLLWDAEAKLACLQDERQVQDFHLKVLLWKNAPPADATANVYREYWCHLYYEEQVGLRKNQGEKWKGKNEL